jgi:hypothetical protein
MSLPKFRTIEHQETAASSTKIPQPGTARRTVQRALKRLAEVALVIEVGRSATVPNRAYRWGRSEL